MKPTLLSTIALVALLTIFSNSSSANTYYWVSTGSPNSNWSTLGNWHISSGTPTSLPGTGDSVVFTESYSLYHCIIDTSVNILSIRLDGSYDSTVAQSSGNTITATYAKFSGGTFLGNNAAITFSSLTLNGGTFTATSGITTLKGNFSYTGGTFYPNGGRVVFYKTLTVSGVNSSSNINLYDVEFQAIAGNSTITLSNIYFNVADSILLTGSNQLFINASQSTSVINAGGEVKDYNTSGTGGGTTTINVDGSSTQHITGNATTEDVGKLPSLTINSTGTVYLIGYITMGGSTTLTYTAGTINAGTSKVVFYYDNTITGSMTFNNVEFQGTGSTCVVSNTISVNGDVYTTLAGGLSINTGTINIYGSLNINNTTGWNNYGTFNFTGTANDSIISNVSAQEGILGNVTINKTGGVLYFIGTINVDFSWVNYSPSSYINPGTSTLNFFFDYNGYNIYIGGSYPTPAYNVTITSSVENGDYYYDIASDSALSIRHTLTFAGNNTQSLYGNSLNIRGNIKITNTGIHDSYVGGGTTVLNLVGSANDSIISTVSLGEGLLGAVAINKTGGTLYLSGNISIATSWMNYIPTADINPGTSTLGFASISGATVDIGGTYPTPVWNVNFGAISSQYSDYYSIQLDSALSVRHTLTLAGSSPQEIDGNTINVLGNIEITNTAIHNSTMGGGTTVLNLVGSANDSIISTVSLGDGLLGEVAINKTGGTLYLSGNISIANSWMNYIPTADINPGTSTLGFASISGVTVDIGGTYPTPVWNVNFGAIDGQYTCYYSIQSDSALSVQHSLIWAGGNYQVLEGHSLDILGNVSITNTLTEDGGSTILYFHGSANDSIIASSGVTVAEGTLPAININKPGGTLYLSGNISINTNWTYINGTVNAGTSTIAMYSSYTLIGATGSDTMSFNNLVFAGSTTLGSAIKIGGNLTINSGSSLNTSSSGNYQITLDGNWINNGTYTGNNSNVTFNGSGSNYIEGSTNTSFYSLTLNQTGALTLSNPTTVTNSLNLTNGDILSSSTDLITLNNGSSVSGGSNNSFVNGPIKKIGNSAFTFPTGAGTSYHPIGITAPSSTSDAFEAQYFNTPQTEGSATDDSLTYICTCDYWTLSQPTGTSSSVDVSLFWGTNSCNIDRLSSLRVGYWNTSGSGEWTNLGQSANTGSTTSGSVKSATASSLSTSNTYFAISKHSPTPTASAGSNVTICYGTNTNLSATATGGLSPYTYSWSPATGLSSSTVYNPTASPTATTTYTVTVEDDDNAPTATATVVVTVNPQLIVNAGSDTTIYGLPTILTLGGSPTASGGTAPYNYLWSPSEFLNDSTIANPTATLTTPDSIIYTLHVTDSIECSSNTGVVVRGLNDISIGYTCNGTICTGDTAYFSAITGYTLYQYEQNSDGFVWYITNEETGSIDSTAKALADSANYPYQYIFTTPGYYCITFQVYHFNGSTWIEQGTRSNACCVYVQGNNPTLSFTGPTTGCPDINYQFTNTSTNIIGSIQTTWFTTAPYGQISCLPEFSNITTCDSIEFSDLQTGTCNVCMIITGTCFGPDTICHAITISNPCNFTYTTSNCNLTANFTPNTTCDTSGNIYSWNFDNPASGSSNTSNLPNPSHTFSSYGTYIISLTVIDPYDDTCTSRDTITLTDPVVITASSNTTICHGNSTVLTALGGVAYTWSPSTGLSATTGSSVTANPTVTTTYTVTGTSSGGCNNTATVIVYVETLSVSASPSSTICDGNGTILTASNGSGSYTWSPSTGLNHTTGSSVTANLTTTTTYTVNDAHCSDSIIVTINPKPTITISGSTSICLGSSTTLTASGAETYAWSPSTGLSATTGSSVTANPTTTKVYTVTGTSSYGCTGDTTVTVTVYPPPTITDSPTIISICNGRDTITASGAETYTWSPSTELSATTGSSITANPTIATTYTITGTDSHGCTGSATVQVFPCCNADSGGITLSNVKSSTLYKYIPLDSLADPLTISDYIKGELVFNNTWEIDRNTELWNDTLEFGPNAKIIIDSGVQLEIYTDFYTGPTTLTDACDYMWNGITINDSTANLLIENVTTDRPTTIANADIAVTSNSGGVYTIENTDFINNYIGIYANNSSYKNSSTIIQSDFSCTTGGLIAPYAGATTLSGISLNMVNGITIGDSSLDDINTFKNLNNGITVNNSPGPPPEVRLPYNPHPVYINYNVFKKIQNYNHNNLADGNGIYVVGALQAGHDEIPSYCWIYQKGMNSVSATDDFDSCYNGIYMNSYGNCSFANNNMKDVVAGISIVNSPWAALGIYNNDITEVSFSEFSNYPYAGIDIEDNSNAPSQTTINCNTITTNAGGAGIILNSTSNSTANSNYINLATGIFEFGTPVFSPTGIKLQGAGVVTGWGSTLNGNYIQGTPTGGGALSGIGINCSGSQFCAIIGNYTNNVQDGLAIGRACVGTEFWNNVMKWSEYGFKAYLNSDIGEQGLVGSSKYASGNQWVGEDSTYGYAFDNSDDYGAISFSDSVEFIPFLVNSDTKPYICNKSLNIVFRDSSYSGKTFSLVDCPVYTRSLSVDIDTVTGIDTTTAKSIVNDSLFSDSDYVMPGGDVWNTKRALYNYILRDTSVLSVLPVLRTFMDTAETGAIGGYTAVSDSILNLMDSVSLSLSDSIRAIKIGSIVSANATLPNTELYEYVQQMVNAVYLETVAEGIDTFSSGQQDTLQYIAYQCIDDAGAAVYDARSLVKLYDDSIYFNDSVICTDGFAVDKMKIKSTVQSTASYLNVYPNPTKDEVTISYQLTGNNGVFYLYSITGQLVESFEINTQSGQTILSVADVPAGIYIYKLISQGDSNRIGKLAVIK